MSQSLEIQPELDCAACGQPGAYVLGAQAWCVECYAEVSSSCAGGGIMDKRNDLATPARPD